MGFILDFEVLDAAITHAVEHPSEFDMDFWFHRQPCGTTACLAGTIAMQAGYQPVWNGDGTFDFAAWVLVPDGTRDTAWHVAARLLGFDVNDSDIGGLFYAADLAEVIAIRNRLARKAGVPRRTWDVPTAVTT